MTNQFGVNYTTNYVHKALGHYFKFMYIHIQQKAIRQGLGALLWHLVAFLCMIKRAQKLQSRLEKLSSASEVSC